MRWLVMLAQVLAFGCVETVSTEPLGDYTTWKRIDVQGSAPGHGDTYRVIYVNDIAATADSLSPTYPLGSTIVKEIRDNNEGTPGDLQYIAVMRQTRLPDTALVDEGGWLFTEADSADEPEHSPSFCWSRCHVAAPYNGAFLDYRK